MVASHTETPVVSGEFVCKNNVSSSYMMRQQRMMPEASDNGSQPYRNAFRCFEMAGMRCNKNNSLPLGRRHGLLVPLTWAALVPYLKARFYVRCPSYQPFRRTHRHGCMAGYHCLMPKGIIFVATPFPIYRHSFKKRSGAYTAARSAFHYLR